MWISPDLRKCLLNAAKTLRARPLSRRGPYEGMTDEVLDDAISRLSLDEEAEFIEGLRDKHERFIDNLVEQW